MQWIRSSEKPHPDKPGIVSDEHVPCLVVLDGEVMILQWDCQDLVWKDESGKYFICRSDEVTHWMPLPEPPTE